jgi:hypothetical protein
MPKRICSKCRSEATLNEKGEYTAIAWHCSKCTRGACRHAVWYSVKKGKNEPKLCDLCYIDALDASAIKKGAA